VSWVRGAAKCPYGPRQNASYVMTADGNYYSATVADFAGRDAAVYRSMGPGRQLRTAQYNSRWLNGASYVSRTTADRPLPFSLCSSLTVSPRTFDRLPAFLRNLKVAFLRHSLGALRVTGTLDPELEKPVIDFLLVITELFFAILRLPQ